MDVGEMIIYKVWFIHYTLLAWSAPSAIMTGGMGFGGQVGKYRSIKKYAYIYLYLWTGAELTDFIMVLNTTAAVKSFMDHGSITLGGNISGKDHTTIHIYIYI